jgi:hypothetical protein
MGTQARRLGPKQALALNPEFYKTFDTALRFFYSICTISTFRKEDRLERLRNWTFMRHLFSYVKKTGNLGDFRPAGTANPDTLVGCAQVRKYTKKVNVWCTAGSPARCTVCMFFSPGCTVHSHLRSIHCRR